MKLHFVEEMDQVLKLALEGNLPELREETPEALTPVLPPAGIDIPQPISHQ
jgi:ATP-dependent Lon protease